ncbi:ABC transporter substrate-binding protein [Mesorhizobium sp. BAC0120]|nr:ABC transporter substrate-binding protein [Mesorhizobium sp. BAC0120]MDW6023813.1 ABC transporter substrate-binding protein [Mesorhizobium sp. BAC0120]
MLAGLGASAMPAEAKTLVIARDMDINSLDMDRSWCDTCMIYNAAVYEGLLALDKDNKVVPVIAESWTVNDDQTEFTFKLNPKAVFSDGSKVEAKDVKWSWERLKNMKGGPADLASSIASVEAPDAQTVVVKTSEPNSELLNVLAASYFGVINSDVAQSEGKATAAEDAAQSDQAEPWFLAHSAGAGPFVLDSYQPGAELRLKRNENYWREPAKIDEVVIRQVGDAVAQAQLLQSGQTDIAMNIDPETAKTLIGPDVKTESAPSNNFVYLAISPGAVANPFPLTPEIREAISHAIDRKSLVEFTLGEGNGRLISVPFPLDFPGAAGHAIPEYDVEKSKELLTKAGHADGFTLEATYPKLNVYGVDFSLAMQKIQQDLAAVNIKLELKPVEFPNWREAATKDHIPITFVFFAPDYYGTSQYVNYFGLAPDSPWAKRGGAERDPSFVLPETKTMLAEALKSPPEKAEKIYFDIGEKIKAQNIIIPMMSPNTILAYGSKVHGVRNSPSSNVPLYEISLDD